MSENQATESQAVRLARVLTDEEFEQIYQSVYPNFRPFEAADTLYLQTLMCAAIKFDRARSRGKDGD